MAVISQHFYNNSVMDFYAHTLINFPDAFHVTIINVDPTKIDDITKALYRRADKHYQTSKAQDELVPLVMESQFDMVIYPEIGMSAVHLLFGHATVSTNSNGTHGSSRNHGHDHHRLLCKLGKLSWKKKHTHNLRNN